MIEVTPGSGGASGSDPMDEPAAGKAEETNQQILKNKNQIQMINKVQMVVEVKVVNKTHKVVNQILKIKNKNHKVIHKVIVKISKQKRKKEKD